MFLQAIIVLALLIPILAIVLDSQLGRALASRLERRSLEQPDDLVSERIGYLEGEVDRLSQEIGRLSEEGQFLQQLLEERQGGAEALPPGDDQDR
jgi:hypothetical protein